MEFFDKLGETLVSAGRDVGQKAKDVSEIARLRIDIRAKEEYVQGQYAAIGAAYYEKHKDDDAPEAEQFFLIREALEEIARMKAEVLRIQGACECPNCGHRVPEQAALCRSCGAQLGDMSGV